MTPSRQALQDRAAQAFAAGESYRVISGKLRISTATLSRWALEPSFLRQVEHHRLAMTKQIAGELVVAAKEAVFTLRELMGPGHPPAVRARAAHTLLGSYLGATATIDKATTAAPAGSGATDVNLIEAIPPEMMTMLLASGARIESCDFSAVADDVLQKVLAAVEAEFTVLPATHPATNGQHPGS